MLWEVPLFGGLSKILRQIVPRLGFTSQTDFKASYVIRDSKVHSEDILMEGPVLNIKASGDYYFNENLDYDVSVQILGDKSLFEEAVQVVLFPINRMLRFHLGGTVTEPEWEPRNWPTELLKMFEGTND
jgi:hypothetical protein